MSLRGRWLSWGLLGYLAIILAVAASLWLLYSGARQRLDVSLGQRLAAVANTAALLVEDGDALLGWSFGDDESTEFLWLASRFEQIRAENDLAEVALCDPFGTVLISASGRLDRGEPNVFWQLDPGAVDLAVSGFSSESRLYRRGELYQKSAHAPVFTSNGEVAGVLTVEGAADFFDSLATLRSGALLTLALVMAFLTVMGGFFWQTSRSIARYRESMLRQESLAAMGRMTAGIAHEIRNPLSIIKGAGEHLRRRLAEVGQDDEVSLYIADEVDRLDRILTGYLAFGTDTPSEPELFDLAKLVHRCAQLMKDELADNRIQVEFEDRCGTAEMVGDPRRLQQVLLNLILNARDAMSAGGDVILTLECRGADHVLTVADSGDGLGDVDPDKIFAPFWTSKAQGSGLGLALSRQIVEQHGGSIELSNRSGGSGAVATIVLPRSATQEA